MKQEERIEKARALLAPCTLCPRRCEVDRLAGEEGFCGMGAGLAVSSHGPHFGEERELVVRRGSGTIFMTGCNLGCLFCQNADISHMRRGRTVTEDELVGMMLSLQAGGCHNVNFVTPTHFTPQIMAAIRAARAAGMTLPVVYNCGGYESLETLRLLEGFVQIYMPDLKFMDAAAAGELAQAPDYPAVAKAAFKEMHRQVGDLHVNGEGAAVRGLLVRHLVMPGGMAGTREAMRFLAEEISADTYVNIMEQYRPCFRAGEIEAINRPPSNAEYREALQIAGEAGLHRGF